MCRHVVCEGAGPLVLACRGAPVSTSTAVLWADLFCQAGFVTGFGKQTPVRFLSDLGQEENLSWENPMIWNRTIFGLFNRKLIIFQVQTVDLLLKVTGRLLEVSWNPASQDTRLNALDTHNIEFVSGCVVCVCTSIHIYMHIHNNTHRCVYGRVNTCFNIYCAYCLFIHQYIIMRIQTDVCISNRCLCIYMNIYYLHTYSCPNHIVNKS